MNSKEDLLFPHGLNSSNSTDILHPLYEVEGPWNYKDPVHEQITQRALQTADLIPAGASYKLGMAWEFIRGVYWNDDPELLLFDRNDEPGDFSTGFLFALKWAKVKQQAKSEGAWFGPGTTLLGRSHFGDLQYLHSMASRNNEPAEVTREAILAWIEVLYSVGVGRIHDDSPVNSVLGGRLSRFFPGNGLSIRELLTSDHGGVVRQRAVGALMHVIQDSYAVGHVERDGDGAILEFHCYIDQDEHRHAAGDQLASGGIDSMPGALAAVESCARVLHYYQAARKWSMVKPFIENEVFKLSERARPSSPGEEFMTVTPFGALDSTGVVAAAFSYKAIGYVFDYDPEANLGVGDHEQTSFDWGSSIDIVSDGNAQLRHHRCVVDEEVELQLSIFFEMRADLDLRVWAFVELLEGSSQLGRMQIYKGTIGPKEILREESVVIFDEILGIPSKDHAKLKVIVTNE